MLDERRVYGSSKSFCLMQFTSSNTAVRSAQMQGLANRRISRRDARTAGHIEDHVHTAARFCNYRKRIETTLKEYKADFTKAEYQTFEAFNGLMLSNVEDVAVQPVPNASRYSSLCTESLSRWNLGLGPRAAMRVLLCRTSPSPHLPPMPSPSQPPTTSAPRSEPVDC